MDAVADLTAQRSRIVLTNAVSRKEGNFASDYIIKNLAKVKEVDLFKLGPLFCDFGTDYLRAVQKTTEENTKRLTFLLKEQENYFRRKRISLPLVSRFSKDDDKENLLAEEKKDSGSCGKRRDEASNEVESSTVERTETDEGDCVINVLENNVSVNETSPNGSEKLLLFGWDSDAERNEDKTDESCRPARFSLDRETTRTLEINLPLFDPDPSKTGSEKEKEKEREYVSLYFSETEEAEGSELPCSSKDVEKVSVPKGSPACYRNSRSAPRFYTRRNMKRVETKTLSVTSSSRDSGGNVQIKSLEGPSKTTSDEAQEEEEEEEPFFVISSVVGNADFVFTENAEESDRAWSGENEESDGNRSTITPKKTDDITKIKGWRKKQFARGKDFPEESRAGEVSDSEDAVENPRVNEPFLTDVVIKQEPPDETEFADSAFVCDSLDDFLDKEADLKINYEIPHLYAEVGIKLTSDEIVSRPNVNEPEPESAIRPPNPDERSRDRPDRSAEGKPKITKSGCDEPGARKRTDDRKMRDKCIRNLIDHRFHYVSSGGELVKISGSYDSLPIANADGRQGKLAFWGNKTKVFDDIFNDLMEEDEVNEERAADRSVVLLHNRKTVPEFPARSKRETPHRSSVDDKTEPAPEIVKSPVSIPETEPEPDPAPNRPEILECVIPDEEIPEKETGTRMGCKLVGLAVYPAPYRPLPSVVQYHLRKLRSYRTRIDREWANFAVSALDFNRDPRKRARMILPVFCPVLDFDKEPVKDYESYCREILDPFRNGSYFKSFKNDFGNVRVSKEVREATDFLLETVENSTEGRSSEKESSKKRRGKGRASKISSDHIISSDEKRTRKLPGRYKDTTILEENFFPSALRSCDFSAPSVTVSDCPRRPYSRRWQEKIKVWRREHGLKECKVVMHRMKGLSRVAPWCMKHECYSCQPCKLKNLFSSNFFKFQNGKRKRPGSGWNKNSLGFSKNVALKKTGPRSGYFLRQDVYSVPVPDEKWDLGRNVPLPMRNIFSETEEEKEKRRFTLESVFEEEERTRIAETTRTVRQITFNKVVTKLLSEKLKDLKSTKTITGSIDDLRRLRPNVIELIKLNFVKESFNCGYINIWYLRGKTASKSRAFLTFSDYPPVDGAVNLKSAGFFARDLPKVITEIVSEKGRFDSDDYAILHCDGSLWEIHGSVNFTVEKSESLERPIEETKIVYADEVIVSELRFMTRLHPGKIFDKPAKWWMMDLSQEYLELLAQVDGQVFKFSREDIMRYAESKVPRFVNIGRHGSPIFGVYIIPSVLPYGLVGPYHLHENHGLELKIHEKTVPFIYSVPGSSTPRLYPDVVPAFSEPPEQTDVPFGLKNLIGQTVLDFDANHKIVVGMWLHDKTVKKEPSFLEIQTKLKKMPPPVVPRRNMGYDLALEHDYSLSERKKDCDYDGRRNSSTSSRTSGVDPSKNRYGKGADDFEEDEPEFSVYLVPDIPNLGYVKGQLMSDHSITIRHPLTASKLINSLKMDEWLNVFLRQKIQFIPKDLKVKWRTVTDIENLADEKPLNRFCLGGTHILCQKGLFYMLSINKTMLETLGLDKSDVLKAISDSTIIKEVMEVKELGKLVTMESECNLSIFDVLQLAIKEIKGLQARFEELTKIKTAAEKRKQKLCRQYTETLKSCSFDDERKKRLFFNVKTKLLAIQTERRKSEGSQSSAKTTKKKKPPKKQERSVPGSSEKKEMAPSEQKSISILDPSKIRKKYKPKKSKENKTKKSKEDKTEEEQPVPLTGEGDDEGCGIKIVDVQSVAPEDDVPKPAIEETVSTAEEVPFLRDSDIKELENKLANAYYHLQSKTEPEDTVEYKRLLTRLITISGQLDKMKGVVNEKAGSSPESPVVSRRISTAQPVVPAGPTPQLQQIQSMMTQNQEVQSLRPLFLANPMQPIFLIVDPPPGSVIPVAGQDSPLPSDELDSPENSSENFKYVSPLERTIFNGNQKFKIERKLESAIGRKRDNQYVVHKPSFPPESRLFEGKMEPVESGLHLFVEGSDDGMPTISDVRSLRKPSEDDSTEVPEFSEVRAASNFLISISKDSNKKVRIAKTKPQEGSEKKTVKKMPGRPKPGRAEFIPLTSLNSSKNFTIKRQNLAGGKTEALPSEPQGGKTKTKPKPGPSILKSVLIRRPTPTVSDGTPELTGPWRVSSADALSDALGKTDSAESLERTGNALDENDSDLFSGSKVVFFPAESEEEKKRKSLSSDSTVPAKKSRTESKPFNNPKQAEKNDSDEETSWLTMNTEDIEKNFQKLIEPIIRTD